MSIITDYIVSARWLLWWQDAEVSEDIKFALQSLQCVLHDNKAQYNRGNSLETADRSQSAFIVWKLADMDSLRKTMWDKWFKKKVQAVAG